MAKKRKAAKMKMPKGGMPKAKPEIAMKPTKGIDPSKLTAPKVAAPMAKPKKGYRQRMDMADM